MLTKITFQVQKNFVIFLYHLWINESILSENKSHTYIDNFFIDSKIINLSYYKEIPFYEKINIFYKDKTIYNIVNENNNVVSIKQKKSIIKQNLNIIKEK
jgi:hypothetical protein